MAYNVDKVIKKILEEGECCDEVGTILTSMGVPQGDHFMIIALAAEQADGAMAEMLNAMLEGLEPRI